MYVSTSLTYQLDKIVKLFEVALRSYLSDKISTMFNTKDELKSYLEDLQFKQESSSIVLSGRIENLLKTFVKDYDKIYNLLKDVSNSTIEEDYDNNEVPYVSQLINIITLFFTELNEMNTLEDYDNVEEFLYKCSLYHRVRNDLSHPASRKILRTESSDVLSFIIRTIKNLDDKYFWYSNKNDIEKEIDKYYKEENNKALKFDNLRNMNVTHQKTICREKELEKLKDLIVGNTEYSRVSGSTVVYGYGGVGKTALIVDFIYNIIKEQQSSESINSYDFILFFSSKDERLTTQKTTGEYYIDELSSDIHKFSDILEQILSNLGMETIEDLQQSKMYGLIVIDNIENLKEEEKQKIFSFMRKIPREIQFLITSRNEEPCEEKIHLSEFKDYNKGKDFIENYIYSNNFSIELLQDDINTLLNCTKGNTLLLVQSLISLNEKSTSVLEISNDLNNYESTSFEKVVSFMYKNTFDNAILELEKKGLQAKNIILIATLYDEKIDLYALSNLSSVSLNNVREVANSLTSKLIFNKTNEFYTVNEFASRFIFISLMPNDREKNKIENEIEKYKDNLKAKLNHLEQMKDNNTKIKSIFMDWKPGSYIDTIVIAEVFNMYNKFKDTVSRKNSNKIKELLSEYSKYEYTTKHPYIRFQKARILHIFLYNKYHSVLSEKDVLLEIKRCFEDTLESINTSYSYIKNTESHAAVLFLFGLFSHKNLQDLPQAIRLLENAYNLQSKNNDKKHYLALNELSILYVKMYKKTEDTYYKDEFNNVYKTIINSTVEKHVFDIELYKKLNLKNSELLIK